MPITTGLIVFGSWIVLLALTLASAGRRAGGSDEDGR
jgi:hypothetical protein